MQEEVETEREFVNLSFEGGAPSDAGRRARRVALSLYSLVYGVERKESGKMRIESERR
jgi:hypothetical protein